MNKDLLRWDSKASHPWLVKIIIKYKGKKNGMPGEKTADDMEQLQETITNQLIPIEGYLYIGRDTAGNKRTIYLGCKDYRKPAKVISELIKEHKNEWTIDLEIGKDKYWQSLEHYIV